MSEQNLVSAFVKAQSEMKHAALDSFNPHYKSRFASLQSVIDAAKPALNANGIAFIQKSIPTENGIGVETVLYGYGEEISTGIVEMPAQKASPQNVGSALTYAKRYSLAMAVGIAADEDDDGEAAEPKDAAQAQSPKKPLAADVVSDIEAKAKQASIDIDRITNRYGVHSLKDLSQEEAVEALRIISKQLNKTDDDK
tara:strand:- start:866 stop:1456 length:591 start_codon:yes stop_codon:yes gene_type:complete